jgi:hypothetical protein
MNEAKTDPMRFLQVEAARLRQENRELREEIVTLRSSVRALSTLQDLIHRMSSKTDLFSLLSSLTTKPKNSYSPSFMGRLATGYPVTVSHREKGSRVGLLTTARRSSFTMLTTTPGFTLKLTRPSGSIRKRWPVFP